jgi:hypothetical protein
MTSTTHTPEVEEGCVTLGLPQIPNVTTPSRIEGVCDVRVIEAAGHRHRRGITRAEGSRNK